MPHPLPGKAARIAKDHASPLIPHCDYFERIAFSTDFPHVVMREFALMALRAIASLLHPAERDTLAARLATANRSPWPHAPRADYTEFRYLSRPDTTPRADNAFSLDYDFSKYPVERLCHVFACPGWQVEDQISAVVRRWDATVGGMYEGTCERVPQVKQRTGFSVGQTSIVEPERPSASTAKRGCQRGYWHSISELKAVITVL